jgi:aklavinone 12-hydroxylase
VEPVLRRFAEWHGAEIRGSTELVSFEERQDGVLAQLRDRVSGNETRVFADYLVAADGARSRVRRTLGIGSTGRGTLSHNMAVVFTAERLPKSERKMVLYYLRNPGFTGAYISPDLDGRAVISVEYDPEKERRDDFTEERCIALIRAALGTDDVEPNIIEVNSWEMASRVADRMSTKRIFIAGDAAHTMPPTGGLGGQTAIQDGFDIAWKLAMVLRGEAGPRLLATYEEERKPVGEKTTALQTSNYAARMRPDREDIASTIIEDDYAGVAFGYRYRSKAIIPDCPDDGTFAENPMQPSGRPGTRAPHLVFEAKGRLVSTLDLVAGGFVLLLGRNADAFADAGARLIREEDAPMTRLRLGADLTEPGSGTEPGFEQGFGVGPRGAVLLRPDGFIAWRARDAVADADGALTEALTRVLCRPFDMKRQEWAPTRGAA